MQGGVLNCLSRRVKISKVIQAQNSMHTGLAHWGTLRRLLSGGLRQVGEKPAEADSESLGPACLGVSPAPRWCSYVLRNPLAPSLTFALLLLGSGSDPSPQAPPAVLSQETSGSRQHFSPLQDWASGLAPRSRSAQLGLPPATCHLPTWTPLCPCWRSFGRLCALRLCSLIRKQAAGGLRSQSERFIVVFRGRLGAM